MSSPAEAHAELEREKRTLNRKKRMNRQLGFLHEMNRECGFGSAASSDWLEREIAKHLEAAYHLLGLEHNRS